MRAQPRTVAWALGASLGTHLVAMSALTSLPPAPVVYDIDLPLADTTAPTTHATPTARAPDPEHAPPPTFGRPDQRENLDTPRHTGGEATGAAEVITLVSRTDVLTLTSTITNTAEANQLQRIRTARDRATPWQGRATPSPQEAPFLASGEGTRAERRVPDARDAALGTRVAGARTDVGGRVGGDVTGTAQLADAHTPGDSAQRGDTRARAGAGVTGGTGRVATTRADVAHARPALERGLPTLHAPVIYELPRDTVDSEALTARLSQSFVDTSRRAAAREGGGAGGAPGEQAGGRSSPVAPGPGTDGTLDISSGRYRTFYLALRREVERHLTFPRERALHLDQGHAVFRITLRRDGTLARPPVLVRSTGFADLDAVSRTAIERARFEAVPHDLSPTSSSVTIRISVASRNPVVR